MYKIVQKYLNNWCPSGLEFQRTCPGQNVANGFTSGVCDFDLASVIQFSSHPILYIKSNDFFNNPFRVKLFGSYYSSADGSCLGSSPYVARCSGASLPYLICVDLVQAYADALWSSSVAVDICMSRDPAAGSHSGSVDISSWWGAATKQTLTGVGVATTTPYDCATAKIATVTVTDAGGISIA